MVSKMHLELCQLTEQVHSVLPIHWDFHLISVIVRCGHRSGAFVVLITKKLL